MMYSNLNDAAKHTGLPLLEKGDIKIFYSKNNHFRHVSLLAYSKQDLSELFSNMEITHVLVGEIGGKEEYTPQEFFKCLENIYHVMQGDIWSPNGEANSLIKGMETHTSMSMGDLIVYKQELYSVSAFGFTKTLCP